MAGEKDFCWMVKGVLGENFPGYVSPRKSKLLTCRGPYGLEVQFQLRFQPGVIISAESLPRPRNYYGEREELPGEFTISLEVVRCTHPAIKAAFKITCGGLPDIKLMENTSNEMVWHQFDTLTIEGRKYNWRVPTETMSRMKSVIKRHFHRQSHSLFGRLAIWSPPQPTDEDFNIVVRVFHVEVSLSEHLNRQNNEFSDQFWSMYQDKKLTDFSIIVGENHFAVHKLILAARSLVFAAMFEHDVAETEQNCVVITDFDVVVIENFIKYLYTGKCDLKEHAAELLVCAEKYNVDLLKSECQAVLIGQLTSRNAAFVLQLADMNGARALREASLNFISKYTKEVMSTYWWASLNPKFIGIILHYSFISALLFISFRRSSIQPLIRQGVDCGGAFSSKLLRW